MVSSDPDQSDGSYEHWPITVLNASSGSLGIYRALYPRSAWRHIREPKTILIISTAILLYVEIFDTLFVPILWPSKHCDECFRVLFVADPQIGGEQHERVSLLRWDSDRYLSKWYARAFSHVSPNAVIFLGDLMDEGSIATDEEFQRYSRRFFNIFPPKQDVYYMYLPGDNDIGGEDGELIFPRVVKRFFHTFKNTTEGYLGPVLFLKVNLPLEMHPISHIPGRNTNMTILVSHFPLLSSGAFRRPPFSVERFRPNLVISAHSHVSELRHYGEFESSFLNKISVTVSSNPSLEELVEISVPTCSYRMGVNRMGYGSLVIDPGRRELFYAVLWLPNRFSQLYILASIGVFLVVYSLVVYLCKLRKSDFRSLCDMF